MELADKLAKYNKKQVDFIMAMLENGNISKSAKIANITETTAFKYLKDGLNEDIKSIRKLQIEENLKQFEFASLKATEVIINILEDENCPKSIKLNASKTVLDYSLKIREQTEIIERLKNIEEKMEKIDDRQRYIE